MPLQPHATEQVEKQIEDLWDAFLAGSKISAHHDQHADLWEHFKKYVQRKHPVLADYARDYNPRYWR